MLHYHSLREQRGRKQLPARARHSHFDRNAMHDSSPATSGHHPQFPLEARRSHACHTGFHSVSFNHRTMGSRGVNTHGDHHRSVSPVLPRTPSLFGVAHHAHRTSPAKGNGLSNNCSFILWFLCNPVAGTETHFCNTKQRYYQNYENNYFEIFGFLINLINNWIKYHREKSYYKICR